MEYLKNNKEKIIKFTFMTLFILLCIFLITQGISADVGNNNRYDSGSSSSSGGSADSDGLFLLYILLELLELLIALFGPFGIIIFIAILGVAGFFLYKNKDKLSKVTNEIATTSLDDTTFNINPSFNEEDVIKEIIFNDEGFSADAFKQYASECFVTLQTAWTERNWEPIRHFESDTLFNMHNRQLQEYVRNGTINVVEKINVKSTDIISRDIQGDKEVVCVKLRTIMRDYIIDEKTKEVVEGDKYRDFHTTYRMEFIRTLGVKTEVGKELSVTNCPNCGAPTTVTSSGQCEYCDSVITSGKYNWVLNELTTF